MQLAGRLLKTHNLSDADSDDIPAELYTSLGIEEDRIYECLDEVFQGKDALDEMTTSLSA